MMIEICGEREIKIIFDNSVSRNYWMKYIIELIGNNDQPKRIRRNAEINIEGSQFGEI